MIIHNNSSKAMAVSVPNYPYTINIIAPYEYINFPVNLTRTINDNIGIADERFIIEELEIKLLED